MKKLNSIEYHAFKIQLLGIILNFAFYLKHTTNLATFAIIKQI